MSTVRLDFDFKYNRENIERIRKSILETAELLNLKVRHIVVYKSYSGNIHAYVHLREKLGPIEEVYFELLSGSDKYRIVANMRRIENNYPYGHSYLFVWYLKKPKVKRCHEPLDTYFIYVLAMAIRYLSKS